MGTDYRSNDGYYVSLEKMINLVTCANFKEIFNLLRKSGISSPKEVYPSPDASFEECVNWIGNLHDVSNYPDEEYVDCLNEIWSLIVESSGLNLPEFECLYFSDDGYTHTDDFAFDEFFFIFDRDDCYIEKISPKGSALKSFAGMNHVSWTDIC